MSITAQQVQELRAKTGAGMMDCKKALTAENGDFEKAVAYLRKKGLASASKKNERIAADGVIQAYIHGGGRIGVLVEINSETDFVARSEDFINFSKDVAMHIAAYQPSYVHRDEMPAELVAKEKAINEEMVAAKANPNANLENMIAKRMDKFFAEHCLLDQAFVKDPSKTVEAARIELVSKIGEKIAIRRFARFALGEGIERKSEDFAAEVAKTAAGG